MRDHSRAARRVVPVWVQDLSDTTLHSMAIHLRIERIEASLSEAQEWLWDRLITELVWRNKAVPPSMRCSCDLCLDPFMGEQATIDDYTQRDPFAL